MYEVYIICFCFLRSIIMRFLNKKKSPQQQDKIRNEQLKNQQNKQGAHQSPQKIQLQQLKDRRKSIQETIEQFNTPSTFAKYSKMQRQLLKLNNQISSLQQKISKQPQLFQKQVPKTSQQRTKSSQLEERRKQVKEIHSKIGNKDLLIKALTNLALIILCSYVQTQQISLCAGYPLYAFCNQSGKINGAWIFIISSILFSY